MLTTTVAGRTWDYSHTIGRESAFGGAGFARATGLALNPGGIIYVLSRGQIIRDETRRIAKLNIDEEYFGDFPSGEQLIWPAMLATDRGGNVYCSDEHRNLIVVFDPDGQQLGEWGEQGSGEGQFRGPSGLAFDAEDNLYVTDSLNHRVQKYTKDGRYLLEWGGEGSGEGQFDRPWGISVDHKGDVYVADWGNDRVQKFSPDGEYLMSFGSAGFDDGGDLDHPADVAVDSDGDVYVTDWANNRVQIYDADGDILTALYGDAVEFSKWANEVVEANLDVIKAYRRVEDVSLLARFDRPCGIKIDDQDRIIVVDSNSGRLQVYKKLRDYLDPQFNL